MTPEEQPENKAERLTPHRWQPGQSGNPKGRPKGSGLTDRLRKILEGTEDGQEKTVGQKLMEAGVDAAMKGDFRFWNAIYERYEGKVPDSLISDNINKIVVERRKAEKESTHTDDE